MAASIFLSLWLSLGLNCARSISSRTSKVQLHRRSREGEAALRRLLQHMDVFRKEGLSLRTHDISFKKHLALELPAASAWGKGS